MKKKVYFYYLKVVKLVYQLVSLLVPIRKRLILFESSVGRAYAGNPKYIYEELVKQGLDRLYVCVWVLNDVGVSIPGNCIKVKRLRLRHLIYAATAKVWIMDSRQTDEFVKRKGTIFIQTWHGTPLKRLALDMKVMNIGGDTNLSRYKTVFHKHTRTWDYLISQNSYSTEKFKSAFSFQRDIWELGYPRNDILVNCNEEKYIQQLKEKLGLPQDRKIILYAPTWRDDEYYEPGKWKLNLHIDIEQLKKRFGKKYLIIIKLHYFMQDAVPSAAENGDFVRVYGPEHDIQCLYLVSDMMITDYSSVMFDYSVLKRPMIFYIYDYEKYKENLRGFYFDIFKEVPGPIAYNQEELHEAIAICETEYDQFRDKYREFNQRYNHLDDGRASSRVVSHIQQILNIK
jgi:CDP-glycerol glycerophosphotransferase